jgi:hypothetical protein
MPPWMNCCNFPVSRAFVTKFAAAAEAPSSPAVRPGRKIEPTAIRSRKIDRTLPTVGAIGISVART